MGPLGWQETVFIFILALLIFGPKKLPELGKTIGKAMTEFRRASNELKSTFEREMQSLERENESLKEVTNSYYNDTSSSSYDYNYDSSSYDSGYNYESSDSTTAADVSTTSASAPQGAESPSVAETKPPEGTIAHGTETAAVTGGSETKPAEAAPSAEAAKDPAGVGSHEATEQKA